MQGCLAPLRALMRAIGFDAQRDRAWFVGDLVNRGPDSLGCLRYVRSLGDAAITVLGNHDLHLLARAEDATHARKRDTLDDVLAAPDRDELFEWLRQQPMMHAEGDFALVHAGLLPQWTVSRALELAHEVEEKLRGKRRDRVAFLREMYGDEPTRWDDGLRGIERVRVIVNAMTRLRVLEGDGAMALSFKGEPDEGYAGLIPWFEHPRRASAGHAVVCGHWSALGLEMREDLLAIDTGCVWGRRLTAVRLEDRRVFAADCAPAPAPRG